MSEEHGVGGSIPPFSAWVVARYEKHFRHLASDYGCEKSESLLPRLLGMRSRVRQREETTTHLGSLVQKLEHRPDKSKKMERYHQEP